MFSTISTYSAISLVLSKVLLKVCNLCGRLICITRIYEKNCSNSCEWYASTNARKDDPVSHKNSHESPCVLFALSGDLKLVKFSTPYMQKNLLWYLMFGALKTKQPWHRLFNVDIFSDIGGSPQTNPLRQNPVFFQRHYRTPRWKSCGSNTSLLITKQVTLTLQPKEGV